MLDRIKSLLESRKRELFTTPGTDNSASSPRAEDQQAVHVLPAVRNETGIVFPVDNVVPASDPLWLGTLRESVEIRTDASVLIMPDQDIQRLLLKGIPKS